MRLKNSIRKLHSFETGKAKHDIDFGIRYHEDYEDRFQWIDGYAIQNGVMNRTSNGTQEQMPIQL
jgi:Fe(3+) dicitrate transport protein